MGASLTEYRWLWPSALATDPAGPARARRSTRDWVVDTVCFVLGAGFAVLITIDVHRPDPSIMQPWLDTPPWLVMLDGAAGVIAAIGLWWRRRFLLPLAIYMLVLTPFSIASGLSQMIVLFTIAVHHRFTLLAAYLMAGVGANALFPLLRPEIDTGYWETVGWSTAMVVIVALWGMLVRSRRQLIRSWRERAERAEAEQQLRVAQARTLERTRIAREMHDVLAHRISLLSLHAGALEFRPDAPAAEIAGAAAVVRSSAHQALQDLREVIGVLRAGQSDEGVAPERPQPTLSALPALADESRSAGVKIRLDLTADTGAVPLGTGRAAYRIIQEGLTNARRHAPGARVAVAVRGAAGTGLTIEIRNPFPVVAPTVSLPGTGMGLIGLAERASLAGGRLAHGRHSDEFVLSAWLPWPA